MKTTLVLSYQNYELRLMVFACSGKKINLVYDQPVGAWDLLTITDDCSLNQIKTKINEQLKVVQNNFNSLNEHMYVLVDATKEGQQGALTAEARLIKITVNVPNRHEISVDDLAKLDKEAYARSNIIDGKTYTGFLTEGYNINGRQVDRPLGVIAVDSFEVIGSHHYVNSRLVEIFGQLIEQTPFRIKAIYDTDYVFKKQVRINDNSGIVEVGRKDTKFYVNNNHQIQTICTAIGLVNFFNNTFDTLSENNDCDLSKEAVFFLKQHFVFNQASEALKINEAISYNLATNTFRNVLINYFDYFHKELHKGRYPINDFQLIIHDYDATELSQLLSENTDLNITPFHVTNHSFNPGLCSSEQLATCDNGALKAMLVMQDVALYRYWEIR